MGLYKDEYAFVQPQQTIQLWHFFKTVQAKPVLIDFSIFTLITSSKSRLFVQD